MLANRKPARDVCLSDSVEAVHAFFLYQLSISKNQNLHRSEFDYLLYLVPNID